jgi:hypothetical protein
VTNAGQPHLAGLSVVEPPFEGGHKTRAVFDNYSITLDTDLRLAAERIDAYHRNLVTLPVTPKVFSISSAHKKGAGNEA